VSVQVAGVHGTKTKEESTDGIFGVSKAALFLKTGRPERSERWREKERRNDEVIFFHVRNVT